MDLEEMYQLLASINSNNTQTTLKNVMENKYKFRCLKGGL